jgi:hypothetical protein
VQSIALLSTDQSPCFISQPLRSAPCQNSQPLVEGLEPSAWARNDILVEAGEDKDRREIDEVFSSSSSFFPGEV